MGEFRLYVLPISGGGFPVQLAELSLLYDAFKINKVFFQGKKDYFPHLCLGASGGNVAAYVGMAADWYHEGMLRIAENIDKQMFIRSWWPDDLDFIPTWALSVFTGTLYRAGLGPEELLSSAFNKYRIQEVEILTLAFNSSKFMPQIFSNKNSETSFIPEINPTDKRLFGLDKIEFLKGDIAYISKVCMASAAIPIVTQPQYIDNDKYDDGGLSSASPLSVLQSDLEERLSLLSQKTHLFYFSPYDMDDQDDKARYTQYGQARASLVCMVHSRTLQDRANSISLIETISGNKAEVQQFKHASVETLAEALQNYQDYHYVLYFYPDKSPCIDLTNFQPSDINTLIEKVRETFNFDIWYA